MANSENQLNDRFKLPGSSLDEVFKVVQGYANFAKPVALADVSKATGMHNTVISKNAGFLLAIGLIEGGAKKSATDVGKRLGLALMHNVADEVDLILSQVVGENEFLRNILAAVRIRKGMDESALRSHIGYSAGLSKTGSTTTGTGAVVELLRRSGHLRLEDGKFIVTSPSERPSQLPEGSSNEVSPSGVASTPVELLAASGMAVAAPSPFSISIKIEVRCEPSDLDTLGEKLRKVVEDFSKSPEKSESPEQATE